MVAYTLHEGSHALHGGSPALLHCTEVRLHCMEVRLHCMEVHACFAWRSMHALRGDPCMLCVEVCMHCREVCMHCREVHMHCVKACMHGMYVCMDCMEVHMYCMEVRMHCMEVACSGSSSLSCCGWKLKLIYTLHRLCGSGNFIRRFSISSSEIGNLLFKIALLSEIAKPTSHVYMSLYAINCLLYWLLWPVS